MTAHWRNLANTVELVLQAQPSPQPIGLAIFAQLT